jgi:hypothetical protein
MDTAYRVLFAETTVACQNRRQFLQNYCTTALKQENAISPAAQQFITNLSMLESSEIGASKL